MLPIGCPVIIEKFDICRALNLDRYQIVRFLENHTILSVKYYFQCKDQGYLSKFGLKIV